jgi:hypothetical protein
MFGSIEKLWNTHGFEIILTLSLIFIGVFALTRIGKKGSWSSSYTYDGGVNNGGVNNGGVNNGGVNKRGVNKRGVSKGSSGERECRRVLQKIFNKPFKNQRPDFLRNPVTGGRFNLELDCYEESLKLAVEYNGQQHYKYIPYFHKNKEAFYNQKYRDELKTRMCRENRVNLIEVPNTVKVGDIERFIRQKLRLIGYI